MKTQFIDLTSGDRHDVGRGIRVVWAEDSPTTEWSHDRWEGLEPVPAVCDEHSPAECDCPTLPGTEGAVYHARELRAHAGEECLVWDAGMSTWWPSRVVVSL